MLAVSALVMSLLAPEIALNQAAKALWRIHVFDAKIVCSELADGSICRADTPESFYILRCSFSLEYCLVRPYLKQP